MADLFIEAQAWTLFKCAVFLVKGGKLMEQNTI